MLLAKENHAHASKSMRSNNQMLYMEVDQHAIVVADMSRIRGKSEAQ